MDHHLPLNYQAKAEGTEVEAIVAKEEERRRKDARTTAATAPVVTSLPQTRGEGELKNSAAGTTDTARELTTCNPASPAPVQPPWTSGNG